MFVYLSGIIGIEVVKVSIAAYLIKEVELHPEPALEISYFSCSELGKLVL